VDSIQTRAPLCHATRLVVHCRKACHCASINATISVQNSEIVLSFAGSEVCRTDVAWSDVILHVSDGMVNLEYRSTGTHRSSYIPIRCIFEASSHCHDGTSSQSSSPHVRCASCGYVAVGPHIPPCIGSTHDRHHHSVDIEIPTGGPGAARH
jgi:hypothetical protein